MKKKRNFISRLYYERTQCIRQDKWDVSGKAKKHLEATANESRACLGVAGTLWTMARNCVGKELLQNTEWQQRGCKGVSKVLQTVLRFEWFLMNKGSGIEGRLRLWQSLILFIGPPSTRHSARYWKMMLELKMENMDYFVSHHDSRLEAQRCVSCWCVGQWYLVTFIYKELRFIILCSAGHFFPLRAEQVENTKYMWIYVHALTNNLFKHPNCLSDLQHSQCIILHIIKIFNIRFIAVLAKFYLCQVMMCLHT